MCFFNDTATTEIYTYCQPLSLHDALPLYGGDPRRVLDQLRSLPAKIDAIRNAEGRPPEQRGAEDIAHEIEYALKRATVDMRSEEHTSELQSLMRISYAVFCLKKQNIHQHSTYAHKPLLHKKHILYI